ncbi:MAG: hypothetical protein ACI9R3_005810 [Verrucomicrobiales bacterium]|jgi:hypothetical protein
MKAEQRKVKIPRKEMDCASRKDAQLELEIESINTFSFLQAFHPLLMSHQFMANTLTAAALISNILWLGLWIIRRGAVSVM